MNSRRYAEVMDLLDHARDLVNDWHADDESQEQYNRIEEMYRAISDAYNTVEYCAEDEGVTE